jgi:hypothetical protein
MEYVMDRTEDTESGDEPPKRFAFEDTFGRIAFNLAYTDAATAEVCRQIEPIWNAAVASDSFRRIVEVQRLCDTLKLPGPLSCGPRDAKRLVVGSGDKWTGRLPGFTS